MKKLVKMLLALLMVVGVAGCSSDETKTASSTVKGFGGDVTVSVSLKGDKLIEITAVGEAETPEIGGKALEELPKKMVEANSIEVDGISGATITSNAIKAAAKAAIAEAKGDEVKVSFKPGTYSGEASMGTLVPSK